MRVEVAPGKWKEVRVGCCSPLGCLLIVFMLIVYAVVVYSLFLL